MLRRYGRACGRAVLGKTGRRPDGTSGKGRGTISEALGRSVSSSRAAGETLVSAFHLSSRSYANVIRGP